MFYGVQAIKQITSFSSEMSSRYPSAKASDLNPQSPEFPETYVKFPTQGLRVSLGRLPGKKHPASCGQAWGHSFLWNCVSP